MLWRIVALPVGGVSSGKNRRFEPNATQLRTAWTESTRSFENHHLRDKCNTTVPDSPGKYVEHRSCAQIRFGVRPWKYRISTRIGVYHRWKLIVFEKLFVHLSSTFQELSNEPKINGVVNLASCLTIVGQTQNIPEYIAKSLRWAYLGTVWSQKL